MAPAQVIEPKDLPPEVLAASEDAASVSIAPTTLMPVANASAGHSGQPIAHKVMPAASAPVDTGLPAMAGADQGVNGIGWEHDLEAEALELLVSGRHDVWDELTRRFESRLIHAALQNTRGRRIEAAQKLGIGRNTITRKIQELGLE